MNSQINQEIKQFNKIVNFREIGGLKTEDGRMMKLGILFRSEDLSRLSSKDKEKFEQLNIKLICDLRTEKEQKTKPNRIPYNNSIRTVSIPMQSESQAFTRLEFLKFLIGKSKELDFEGLKKDIYYKMAYERTAQINEIITLLSDEKNLPAIIHCTSGMDRTGYISAMIQLLVGVPYKTVLDDYILSNDLIQFRMKKIEKYIRVISLFQIKPERLKPMLEVRREYLDEIINDIITEYGSIEEYLCKACNINQSSILSLRQLLLG